jgi:hypothetical protein
MRRKVLIAFWSILMCLSVAFSAETPFKHPGVLISKSQLDFVKNKISHEPWKSDYDKMMKTKFASLSFEPKPWEVVECGYYSHPDNGCNDEKDSAISAYTHALIWHYTGNKTHANKAIEIMDAWSGVITGHNNSNAPIQTGWSGAMWPRAGEIIRHTNAGWDQHKIKLFEDMLRNVYLPTVSKGSPHFNGNWELSMTEAVGAIAVFLDDHNAFNHAVSMWRKRLPAYIYLKSDGDHPVSPPGGQVYTKSQVIGYWHNQTTFVDGLSQETCRDMGHLTMGLSAAINMAETAWHQGLDLYKEGHDRIVKAMEFHANYILGAKVPEWLCHGELIGNTTPMWEIGYNHYHNRVKENMPKSEEVVTKKVRPSGFAIFQAWETLTHAENPNN